MNLFFVVDDVLCSCPVFCIIVLVVCSLVLFLELAFSLFLIVFCVLVVACVCSLLVLFCSFFVVYCVCTLFLNLFFVVDVVPCSYPLFIVLVFSFLFCLETVVWGCLILFSVLVVRALSFVRVRCLYCWFCFACVLCL